MLVVSIFLALVSFFAPNPDKGKVIVHITDIRSSDGVIAITIFKGGEGFPEDEKKAYKKLIVPISGGKAIAVFDDLPYGEYGVIYMHDENNNGKMDFNFIHIPKEGYGASNNAKASFGPPKYEDAKIILKQSTMQITVKTTYF